MRIVGKFIALLGAASAPQACAAPADPAEQFPDYSGQREPLQKQLGEDIFVAKYQGIVKDDGSMVTFAVWADSVPTALPKVDFVMVQTEDFSQQYMVSWDDLQRNVGAIKQMPNVGPPRFLTPAAIPAKYLDHLRTHYVHPVGWPAPG